MNDDSLYYANVLVSLAIRNKKNYSQYGCQTRPE